MESELIKVALSQGLWAGVSIFLIFYIIKAQEIRDLCQEEREAKYQVIINGLIRNLNLLENIKLDIEEIKANQSKFNKK